MRKVPYTHSQPFLFIVLSVAGASSISMLGGIGIELASENLITIIPLIVALPPLNTLVGDYATVIAARAADPRENNQMRKKLLGAIVFSVCVSVIAVITLSTFVAVARAYTFRATEFIKFALFIASAVALVVATMFVVTRVIDKMFEKRKLNPDDILIPVVTSIADVLMLGFIALAALTLFS